MAKNSEQRAAARAERASDQQAQAVRDGLIVPFEQMNRAERRRYDRAARRGKAPAAARRAPRGGAS